MWEAGTAVVIGGILGILYVCPLPKPAAGLLGVVRQRTWPKQLHWPAGHHLASNCRSKSCLASAYALCHARDC